MSNYYAIIVAGGSGSRMHSEIPKQFIKLNGTPIIMHTVKAFFQNKTNPNIILVLAKADVELWGKLILHHQFDIPHQVVFGGKERFHSVQNGLKVIENKNAVIAIHDAVRPLVSQNTITNCFLNATKNGNAIAAITSKDSVRSLSNGKSKALTRSEIFLVQTPQTFIYHQLNAAYNQEFESFFTDDSSVVEKAGFQINLEKGDDFNFKITFKEDLILAEALLKI
jgi:2-C-methyl-D-erythritol 4-phosphate cytidylyltransferase